MSRTCRRSSFNYRVQFKDAICWGKLTRYERTIHSSYWMDTQPDRTDMINQGQWRRNMEPRCQFLACYISQFIERCNQPLFSLSVIIIYISFIPLNWPEAIVWSFFLTIALKYSIYNDGVLHARSICSSWASLKMTKVNNRLSELWTTCFLSITNRSICKLLQLTCVSHNRNAKTKTTICCQLWIKEVFV